MSGYEISAFARIVLQNASRFGGGFVREFFVLRRHAQIFIGVSNRLDEQAFLRVPRNDGRAGLADFQQAVARIEKEAAFELFTFVTVTFVTILDQQWPNLFFEELSPVRNRALGVQSQDGQQKQQRVE